MYPWENWENFIPQLYFKMDFNKTSGLNSTFEESNSSFKDDFKILQSNISVLEAQLSFLLQKIGKLEENEEISDQTKNQLLYSVSSRICCSFENLSADLRGVNEHEILGLIGYGHFHLSDARRLRFSRGWIGEVMNGHFFLYKFHQI